MQSTCYSCPMLMKFEFSGRIFEKKSSNIKFYENPSSGSRMLTDGQMDRYDEANSRFSQFCERSLKKIVLKPNKMKGLRTYFVF